jgi:signal transduction histidine kinase
MGRLFWKIFLWFWLTLILIGAAVSWGTAIYIQNSDAFQQRDFFSRYVNNRVESLRQVLYYGGAEAASQLLKNKKLQSRNLRLYVVNEDNQDILGRTFSKSSPGFIEHQPVEASDGHTYKIITAQRSRANRSALTMMLRPFRRSPAIYFLWFGIALFMSGLVCFGLARYMSKPIRTLQVAARNFSQGKLDTRVGKLIGNRRDEIADLGQDFDQMAARLQSLINNQRQLLSDISHELRSPLARLHLAVGLARKKAGSEVEAEMLRIEQETNRLDDLVGQSLTLSRLDAGAAYPKDDFIDIVELLEDIIKDCDFEAKSKNKQVSFNYKQSWTVNANVELLRRALENIIRNAIHYTAINTKVDVTIEAIQDQNKDNAFEVSVCDQGKGVPEDKLDSLFEPFVRISEARDRDSGGYGLGLAIAKRAIEFHQGSIVASNRKTGGLCVEIILPINASTE